MAHGYLREYDEGWTNEQGERNRRREEDRERGSRDGGRDDRDRSFMFDNREGGGDRARERFRDDDRQWRASPQDRWNNRDWRGGGEDEWRSGHSAFTSGSDWERSPRNFSSQQDDHYRSWRNRQMEALDRDYADYCREREQQFHRDFDTWRNERRGNNPGPLRTGMAQTGQSHDPSGTLELTNEARDNAEPKPDPIDAATLGTNSSGGSR